MEAKYLIQRPIEVSFVNKQNEYTTIKTNINGNDKEIQDYYLGQWFNLGHAGEDSMYMAHAIKFEDTMTFALLDE